MSSEIRWGILGLGSIANKMAEAINRTEGGVVQAVGSRSLEKAEEFAAKHDARRAHGSYEALAADPDLDVIYVATPHPLHAENTILCLDAGKAVLCEKPFAMNAQEAARMVERARQKGLFLMEAMWSRFLPALVEAKRRIEAGEIGEVKMLTADFGFRAQYDPESRIFSPDLGGGALLDVGVYVVSLDSFIFGSPIASASLAKSAPTGVDEQMAMILQHPGGQLSALTCATRTTTAHEAVIYGTEGHIRIRSWWRGGPMTVVRSGKDPEEVTVPTDENGFVYEVQEVNRCLRDGRTESDWMPLDETVSIMRTLDALRDGGAK